MRKLKSREGESAEGRAGSALRPLDPASPHASRSFTACQWIEGVLPWARCEPLQEKALAYERISKEINVEETSGKSEATASCDVSCGEKTAELSALCLMFMDFGGQWDVSELTLRAAGSSLFRVFKKSIRFNMNWIHKPRQNSPPF